MRVGRDFLLRLQGAGLLTPEIPCVLGDPETARPGFASQAPDKAPDQAPDQAPASPDCAAGSTGRTRAQSGEQARAHAQGSGVQVCGVEVSGALSHRSRGARSMEGSRDTGSDARRARPGKGLRSPR